MTCTEADLRHKGDYAYIKAVADGTATAEKEVFAKVGPRIVSESAKAAAKRAKATVKRQTPLVSTGRRRGRVVGPIVHGTMRGARLGCKIDCPGDPETGMTCQQKRAEYQRELWALGKPKRDADRAGNVKTIKHGTMHGANRGCKQDCPASPTCLESRRKYQNARREGNTA
jgi:hypothetical protein